MKIRNGFVSNSSSSSFVVCFPRKPRSLPELQEMLFGNETAYPDPYNSESYAASTVAATVWKDIADQEPMTKEQMAEALSSSYIYEREQDFQPTPGPTYPRFPSNKKWEDKEAQKEYEKQLDAYHEALQSHGMKLAEKLLKECPDGIVYKFEYSDNDGGYYSALEHGGLFRKLPSFRISHH